MRQRSAAFDPDAQKGRVSAKKQPLDLKHLDQSNGLTAGSRAPAGKPAVTLSCFLAHVAKLANATALEAVEPPVIRRTALAGSSPVMRTLYAIDPFCGQGVFLVAVWLIHHEPLALCLFDANNRALAIRCLAAIPSEIELRNVSAKVFSANMVKVSNDATAQQ